MEYLKKYNENNEYYQDITNKSGEAFKQEEDRLIPFDDDDKKILFNRGYYLPSDRQMLLTQASVVIKITKTNDEYYIVYLHNRLTTQRRTFKCDQLDGLIKFLDKLSSIRDFRNI